MLLPLRGSLPHDRRTFLVASGLGLCAGATALAAPVPRQTAKSVIMIWLSGGASHIDTWDMKPQAPLEYRGTFEPISTTSPEIQLCEHLPLTAKQAHLFSVVRSLGDQGRGTGDHHAGYYYNLTGHAPDPTFHRLLNARTPYPTDWPSMASVVAAKRPPHPSLPSAITLPQKEGAPEYTRPGQFAARLGIEYDPVFIDGSQEQPMSFQAPALSLDGGTTIKHLLQRKELLSAIDRAERPFESTDTLSNYSKHQQKAFTLLTSRETKAAFDLAAERVEVRERYGTGIMGMSFLLARRLVEASVPYITVFYKENKELDSLCKSGGGWDTHGNNFGCLKDKLLPEFDRPYSTLLADLHERGLLEQTLVIVSSEMGRRPKIGDPRSGGIGGAGRDHWTSCMSVLLAGGGIQGGRAYGSSDKYAEFPGDKPTSPEDIAHTLFHAMGIDDLTAHDREGRPFPLMDAGRPLYDLFK